MCLEKEELGLNALIRDGGLLAMLKQSFGRLYEERPTESTVRKDQALAEASAWQQRRDTNVAEMSYSVESLWVRLLGMRRWTLDTLYTRIREAAEQQCKAIAAAYVAEETAVIAERGDSFLDEWQLQLHKFKDRLKPIHNHFVGLKKDFMTLGPSVLSVRLFDPERDFESYYKLEFDQGRGQHLQVIPHKEHGRFLREVFPERDGTKSKTTLELIEAARREGEDWLCQALREYAVKRFREDFRDCVLNKENKHANCGRIVTALRHRDMQNPRPDTYERFVSSALPMLRRTVPFSQVAADVVRRAFLGLPARDDEAYRSLQRQVENLLAGHKYPKVDPHLTGDPTAVRLFVESYAFPLPIVDLVNECHDAYYDFYHGSPVAVQDVRSKIPLHIRTDWEGEFDDLKLMDKKSAAARYEAITVLSLGPLLGVIRTDVKSHRRVYSYRLWIPPAAVNEPLGNKREAIERLQAEEKLRAELLRQIGAREEEVRGLVSGPDQPAAKYYWALSYLRFRLFPFGIENSIIVERLKQIQQLLESRSIPLEDLTPLETEHDRAERCKILMGDSVEWSGEFPVLRALRPLILGKQ
jgi:hypothetical protein